MFLMKRPSFRIDNHFWGVTIHSSGLCSVTVFLSRFGNIQGQHQLVRTEETENVQTCSDTLPIGTHEFVVRRYIVVLNIFTLASEREHQLSSE